MNETKANMQNQSTQLNNQVAQLRNLEVQIGQMANLLTERQQGSLPSNSKINPRGEGKEHVKVKTLRSGRELATLGQPPMVREVETEVDQFSPKDQMNKEQPQEKKSVKRSDERKETEKQAVTNEPSALLPYPQPLKNNKFDKHFTKFMEVFKKLHINILFTDALEQMPRYVKLNERYIVKEKKVIRF